MGSGLWSSIGAFAVFAAVLTVTPGLDTMLVLRTTAVTGRRAGLSAVTGVCVGCLVWAVASALGVAAVLATSRLAFEVLRVAGVVYLCWLGVRALWLAAPRRSGAAPWGAARRGRTSVGGDPGGGDLVGGDPVGLHSVRRGWRAFRVGLTTNLLNPKVGAFYLSVLPQFLPSGVNPLAGSLALGVVHVVEGLVWLSVVVLLVSRARRVLTRPVVKRRLEQLAGLAFLGFGLRLALEPAP